MRADERKECGIVERVLRTRRTTIDLVAPLSHEDLVVQSMPDASPAKWHLAHTTWFFDRFVLRSLGLPPVKEEYDYLFNSYYDAVGERHPRSARGLLTRPSADEVFAYRRAVDARIADLEGSPRLGEIAGALELGLNHEEQHQELILTDIKHLFAQNRLLPAYSNEKPPAYESAAPLSWSRNEGGLVDIGHDGRDGNDFSFDNERPKHKVFLAPFEITNRVVTEGEYLAFVHDGGYTRPELWLSEGFAWVTANRQQSKRGPMYWRFEGDAQKSEPRVFTLYGERAFEKDAPVCHVSYYEADAYARWAGARLPTEAEWEIANASATNDVWQWTSSAYSAYPGFEPLEGAFGEYNGKFMVSQMVLRGGSCATPRGHARRTYRNFFPPSAEWQFSGVRLARNA